MKRPHYTPNRQTFLGVLLGQLTAVLMHTDQLPGWLWLPVGLIFLWRWQIYRSEWSLPGKFVRFFLVLVSVVMAVLSFDNWYALEPMIVLLVLAFVLKLLELETRRDFIFLVYVGYVVIGCAFILTQNIALTVLAIISIGLLTALLISVHATETAFFSRRMGRLLGGLTLQLLPIMLVLLFFFPRIGALWTIPALSDTSITGIGDSMSPGDFSQLSRSREIAFRVSFADDQPPAMSERYWRGMVFDRFDGRRWSPGVAVNIDSNVAAQRVLNAPEEATTLDYEVIMEPSNSTWLFVLPVAQSISLPTMLSANNEHQIEKPVTQRIRYKVTTALTHNNRLTSPQILANAMALPSTVNPRSRAAAQQMRQEAGSTEAFINMMLDWYRREFTYTLSPPSLGTHSVDEFLYQTQAGFCEHYASSFVFMMRSAGIPARVVVGYLGGEWNDQEKFLTVRQSDAHAWAEVYLPQRGWLRVDPTAAISPERVELGLESALSGADQALINYGWLGQFTWIRTLGLRWEALNYRWQDFVMSYDQDAQADTLQRILGKVTPLKMALLLMIPGILIPGLIALWSWLARREKSSPMGKLHHQLRQILLATDPDAPIHAGSTFAQLIAVAKTQFPGQAQTWQDFETTLHQHLYTTDTPISRDQTRRWVRWLKTLTSRSH